MTSPIPTLNQVDLHQQLACHLDAINSQEAGEIMDYRDRSWEPPDLKPTTRKNYSYSQSIFLSFCEQFCLTPLPCTEINLLKYIAYLRDDKRLTCNSIHTHLAAVKHLHMMNGFNNTDVFLSPRIKAARSKASKASKFIESKKWIVGTFGNF